METSQKISTDHSEMLRRANENLENANLYGQEHILFAATFHQKMLLKHFTTVYNLAEGDTIVNNSEIVRRDG